MARARADRLYGVIEALYGLEVTDELLRERGLGSTRSEFLRSEFLRSLAIGLALAAAAAAVTVSVALPAWASAAAAAAALVEGFSMSAALGARRLAMPHPRGEGEAARPHAFGRRGSRGRPPELRPHPAVAAERYFGRYSGLVSRIYGRDQVKRLIDVSALALPPDYFYGVVAMAIAIGAAAGLALGVALPLAAGLTGLALPLAIAGLFAGGAAGAVAPYAYISYRASGRRSRLEQDLASWIAAMMAYISSGVSLPEAIRRSALALKPGPLRQELDRANRDAELGSDIGSSLLAMARRSPSPLIGEVVSGLMDALDSGKDLRAFFNEMLNYVLSVRRNYMRKLVNDLLFAAELFVMLFVVTPLLMAIMLAIMGSMSVGAQASYLQLLVVMAYFFIPVMGLGYMVLVDSIYPRWW